MRALLLFVLGCSALSNCAGWTLPAGSRRSLVRSVGFGLAGPLLLPGAARAEGAIGAEEAMQVLKSGRVSSVTFFGSFGERADFSLFDDTVLHVENKKFQPVGDRGPEVLIAAVRNSGVPYKFSFDLSTYSKPKVVMSETAKQQMLAAKEKEEQDVARLAKMEQRLKEQAARASE